MSQTKDVVEDVLEDVLEETNPNTDTNANNTKVLRKRKANTKFELIGNTSKLELRTRTLEFRKRVKRNQAIHKRRKERKEDKFK